MNSRGGVEKTDVKQSHFIPQLHLLLQHKRLQATVSLVKSHIIVGHFEFSSRVLYEFITALQHSFQGT